MDFNEVANGVPNIKVCDIIQLFLLGQDDEIFLNLAKPDENGLFDGYTLKNERIISDKWQPYYENKIKWIEETDPDDYDLGYLTLVI